MRQVLGSGAHGAVCLSDDLCAVKTIKCSDAFGVSVVAMREMRIMKRLGLHPHVVQLHRMTVRDDTLSVVMECYPLSLRQLVLAPLVPIACKRYARHLFLGLAYLQSLSVIHRDIKPDNLLLDTEDNLRIADFGLAREHLPGSNTRCYTHNMVTLWYRSRELFAGQNYAHDVDVWSAGCVVAEMVAGKPLFGCKDEASMVERHTSLLSAKEPKTPTPELLGALGRDEWANEAALFIAPLFAPPETRESAATSLAHVFLAL